MQPKTCQVWATLPLDIELTAAASVVGHRSMSSPRCLQLAVHDACADVGVGVGSLSTNSIDATCI